MAKNTVVVPVLANTSSLKSGLSSAGGSLAKFGAAAVAAGAAIATAIGVKAVKSASALEQSLGAMTSVFKGNAGQMEKWASSAAGSLGLAKSEYASLATVLGSQLKNMGVATEQLGGQTNTLIGLGADLAAQFGGSTSDAVSALSSLLRGERDPIERYGVSINEATVTAKMAEMGLSGLSGEAEKNAKLQATLALLTQQTADAQGAFARESTTLAGSQQRLSAGVENLYATLGTSLLPAVTAVTAALGALVNRMQESEWFQALTANLANASNAFADFVFGILNGTSTIDFGSLIEGLLPALISGIQNAATWLAAGGLQPILASVASGRETMLTAAVQLFTAIGGALPQILPALVAAVITFVQDIVTLLVDSAPSLLAAGVQVFTTLVQSLSVVLPLLITAVNDLLPKLVEAILGMLPGILDAAVNLFTALALSLPIILPLLLNAIYDLLPKIVSTVIGMIPRLINAGVRLFTGLVSALPKVIPKLIAALIGLAPKIVSTVIGLIPQLIRAGVDLIGGLVQGIFHAAGSVGSALLEIAKNAIGDFLGFLGIHSPSRLFMGFGKNTVQGLVLGLTRNAGLVDGAMSRLSTRVSEGFSPLLPVPQLDVADAGGVAVPAGGNTYYVTLQTLNPTAEAGRVIVESIRDYESFGGRA